MDSVEGAIIFGIPILFILIFFGLFWALVDSKEETEVKHQAYLERCLKEGIKTFQCEHMWKVERDTKDTKAMATSAAIISGMAVGISAGKK